MSNGAEFGKRSLLARRRLPIFAKPSALSKSYTRKRNGRDFSQRSERPMNENEDSLKSKMVFRDTGS
jgi:hypothetical protein